MEEIDFYTIEPLKTSQDYQLVSMAILPNFDIELQENIEKVRPWDICLKF